jgi:YggT family protein
VPGIFSLFDVLYQVYFIILIIRVIGSWMPAQPGQSGWASALRLAYALTEPLLGPLRRALRPIQGNSGVDFSPMVLMLIMYAIRAYVFR